VLTPAEFVKAGDELVAKNGSWKWEAGLAAYRKKYLPDDKQYLVTRKVPSLRRANTYALADAKESVVETGELESEGWLETHVGTGLKKLGVEAQEIDGDKKTKEVVEEVGDLSIEDGAKPKEPVSQPEEDVPEIGEIGDGGELLEAQEEDAGTLKATTSSSSSGSSSKGKDGKDPMFHVEEPEDTFVRTRTYDVSITYDKFYRTPRVFLFGYNEHQEPLTPDEIMEDISADHANKTVTVEPHPHTGVSQASIHPCRHASVMKRLVDQLALAAKERAGDKKVPAPTSDKAKTKRKSSSEVAPVVEDDRITVNQYIFLFLKFISSVIPTIDYDYTAAV